MDQLLIATVVPTVIAVVLAVVLLVVIVFWRRGSTSARRELAAAQAAASAPDPQLAERQGRDRIAHDALVGTASSLTAIIDRADSVALTAPQDAAAAARIAAGVGEQLRVVRDDVRRVADLVAPELAAVAAADAAPSELVLPHLVPTSGAVPTSMTQLAVRARDAGLSVRVETVGEPFAVPAPFAAAVMRVVELALENAAVHAGQGATALVVATWTDDALRVAVEDDGVRAAARRDGRDPDAPVPPDADARLAAMTGADGPVITEMRAATAAYDGVFSATAVPGIGFTVTATFPGVRRAPLDDAAAHGAG